jgi:uncharacterized protein
MNSQFIGRISEIDLLKKALDSDRSEMVAVIGRRRVGKTHLIKQAYGGLVDFEITGIQHSTMSLQLANFSNKRRNFLSRGHL